MRLAWSRPLKAFRLALLLLILSIFALDCTFHGGAREPILIFRILAWSFYVAVLLLFAFSLALGRHAIENLFELVMSLSSSDDHHQVAAGLKSTEYEALAIKKEHAFAPMLAEYLGPLIGAYLFSW